MPEESSTGRQFARYAVLALAGGGLVGIAMSGMRWNPRMVLHGAIIGFCCYSLAFLSEVVFHRWLEARPEQWWRRALLYFVASQLGWPIGLFLGMLLIWGRLPPMSVAFNRMSLLVVLVLGVFGVLAGLAAMGFERLKERLRVSIEELKEKEFADKELQLARELQSRMLPAPDIAADGYRISSRNFAARYVAGDFYDIFQYPDGAIGVAVADVAGKGMPASLLMASVKAILPLLASTRSIDAAMVAINEKLVGELAKREFVAMSLARFEPSTGKVSVANAGLPDPYVVRSDGTVSTVEVPGPRLPLGLRRSIAYEKHDLVLDHGEALMLYSDGLPEATTRSGEQLGYDRLTEIIETSGSDVDAIMRSIHQVESEPRDDDQTVVMLQRV